MTEISQIRAEIEIVTTIARALTPPTVRNRINNKDKSKNTNNHIGNYSANDSSNSNRNSSDGRNCYVRHRSNDRKTATVRKNGINTK